MVQTPSIVWYINQSLFVKAYQQFNSTLLAPAYEAVQELILMNLR